jgi:hypothetical protein
MSFCLTAIQNFERHKENIHHYGFLKSLRHVYSIFCQQGRTENK